ncbi:hypothetical protein HPB48_025126 [Haemaphysalis longicornis]|uniref:Uncharacterized protein n=1 Tax=Haemaphysalis longicornis TaxID=44386 RepID=A0A9J6H8Z8_HAELO|nr:hypothetical protein HPB48_025126 [Haemaphysalis longicornis]
MEGLRSNRGLCSEQPLCVGFAVPSDHFVATCLTRRSSYSSNALCSGVTPRQPTFYRNRSASPILFATDGGRNADIRDRWTIASALNRKIRIVSSVAVGRPSERTSEFYGSATPRSSTPKLANEEELPELGLLVFPHFPLSVNSEDIHEARKARAQHRRENKRRGTARSATQGGMAASAASLAAWDALLSLLVCTPLVVAHWRTVWFLLDWLVLPERPFVSGGLCLGLGHAVMLAAHLAQHALAKLGQDAEADNIPPPRRLWLGSVERLYTPVMAVASIVQWRGVWLLQELWLEPAGPLISALISPGGGLPGPDVDGSLEVDGGVASLRLQNGRTADVLRGADEAGPPTGQQGRLDCVLLVLQTFMISGWRGLWALLDVLRRSAKASLASGSAAAVLLLATQSPAGILWRRLGGDDGTSKKVARGLSCIQRVFEVLWFLAATYASVATWRGLWMLIDDWLQEDVLAFALLALGSLFVLHLAHAANNILTVGVSLDGNGVDFDVCFLPEFLTAPSSSWHRLHKMTGRRVQLTVSRQPVETLLQSDMLPQTQQAQKATVKAA